ncbi:MAG: adenylate/guanylate cyclase domain-containing protein [Burkholderiaceae bacterium]
MNSRSLLWRVLRIALLVSALVAAVAHAAGYWPLRFVTQLDLAIADARLRALMPRTLDARIVIVDVDEKSLAEVGRWPWGREQMAALTEELFARQKAAVVGFDMLFAEPETGAALPVLERLAQEVPALAARLPAWRSQLDPDRRFAAALSGREAVLGYYLTSDRGGRQTGKLPAPAFDATVLHGRPVAFTRWDGYAANIDVLARAAPAAGYFNFAPDADGLVRSLPLIATLGNEHHEALALAMFRRFTGALHVLPGFASSGDNTLVSVVLEQAGRRHVIPVDEHARVRVPFRGAGGPGGGSFEYVPASDLLKGRTAPAHLAGKLVLIGSTAPGVYDQRSTPVSAVYPGVEVHANLLSGLLDARVPVQPDWAAGYEIMLLLLIAAALTWGLPRLRAARAAQLTALLSVVLVALNLWAYVARGLVLPLAAPLLLVLLIYLGTTVWGYIVEGRSRRSLARLFGTYVPPELVEEMARDPARYDMRAENRELTVMFCDMRNFTQVSERLAPEDVRGLVNRFFSSMTAAIRAQRGTLDKYIGDAIMAFWGAPLADADHALHAVQAALAMAQRLNALNDDLRERGLPQIGVGIGLNTGLVCVGDMGSDMRRSYTVMGDAVNLASRIEALTRHYGVDVLAGEATVQATRNTSAAGFRWVEVDRVRVKGKQRPVTLFTPVGEAALQPLTFDEEMRLWDLVLTPYRLQHWDEAQAALTTLQTRFDRSPLLGLYQQFDGRIQHHRRAPPPADWDGAHTFDSK